MGTGRRRRPKKWTKKEGRRAKMILWLTRQKDNLLIEKMERRVV